jgi:hypothetical protein
VLRLQPGGGLELVAFVPSGGQVPRSFCVVPGAVGARSAGQRAMCMSYLLRSHTIVANTFYTPANHEQRSAVPDRAEPARSLLVVGNQESDSIRSFWPGLVRSQLSLPLIVPCF